MEYQVVEARSADDLSIAVNELVQSKGWKPQGSVAVSTLMIGPTAIRTTYAQAVIRDLD